MDQQPVRPDLPEGNFADALRLVDLRHRIASGEAWYLDSLRFRNGPLAIVRKLPDMVQVSHKVNDKEGTKVLGLSKISLQLARCPDFPEGNPRDRYEIVAPLDETGRLDTLAWHAQRDYCRVRRVAPDGATRHGRLLHRAGGAGGANWIIDYDDRSDADDESGFHLDSHVMAPGEYVSIKGVDGELRTYAIVAVRAA